MTNKCVLVANWHAALVDKAREGPDGVHFVINQNALPTNQQAFRCLNISLTTERTFDYNECVCKLWSKQLLVIVNQHECLLALSKDTHKAPLFCPIGYLSLGFCDNGHAPMIAC